MKSLDHLKPSPPAPPLQSLATFADYCAQSLTRVQQFNRLLDAQGILASKLAPREIQGSEKPQTAIILVHGLLDSPYYIDDLISHYAESSCLVRSLLLPGHGTVPGDLLNIKYTDWHECLEFCLNTLPDSIEHVCAIGFSTGASLALLHALQANSKIDSLVLLAPAAAIQNPLVALSGWTAWLGSWWSRWQWLRIVKDNDPGKYQSLPYNAIYQVYLLTKQLQLRLQTTELRQPLLLIQSADDQVVSVKAALDVFQRSQHPLSQCLYYSGEESSPLTDPRVTRIDSAFPEQNIMNFSHVCLPVSPQHPQYGVASPNQDYLHYQTIKMPVPKNKPHRLGASKPQDMARYRLQRLTFNPDFANMISVMDEFISAVST